MDKRISTTAVQVGDRIIAHNSRCAMTECEVLRIHGTPGYPVGFHVRWIDGTESRRHRVNPAGSVLRVT